jgi:hypothetical protein
MTKNNASKGSAQNNAKLKRETTQNPTLVILKEWNDKAIPWIPPPSFWRSKATEESHYPCKNYEILHSTSFRSEWRRSVIPTPSLSFPPPPLVIPAPPPVIPTPSCHSHPLPVIPAPPLSFPRKRESRNPAPVILNEVKNPIILAVHERLPRAKALAMTVAWHCHSRESGNPEIRVNQRLSKLKN